MSEYGPGEIHLAPGTLVEGATIRGTTMLVDAQDVSFVDCEFVGDDTPNKGILVFLGGRGCSVVNSRFRGGVQAGQLSIGLNPRVSGAAAIPYDWTVTGCEFDAPDGQWGTYPQSHHIYALSDPTYPQNGRIVDCTFAGHPYGSCVKIGGTGNNPHFEGSRGITVAGCILNGVQGGDGRANTLLVEGERSEAVVADCDFTATNAMPYLQAVDGARLRVTGADLPQGIIEYSSWYWLRIFKQSKKAVAAPGSKPPNIGGISWA